MGATKSERETGERVRALLNGDTAFLELCAVRLYKMQTDDERHDKITKYLNLVGYDKADGHIMTDYSVWLLNGKPIEGDHLRRVLERMYKYSIQLGRYDDIAACLDGANMSDAFDAIRRNVGYQTIADGVQIDDFLTSRKEYRDLMAKLRRKVKNGKAWMINAIFVRESDSGKAILMTVEGKDYWFPKKAVLNSFRDGIGGEQEICVERWIAEKHGFVPCAINARFLRETDKAILVKYGDDEQDEMWIPKSVLTTDVDKTEPWNQEIGVKKWFADKNHWDDLPKIRDEPENVNLSTPGY